MSNSTLTSFEMTSIMIGLVHRTGNVKDVSFKETRNYSLIGHVSSLPLKCFKCITLK